MSKIRKGKKQLLILLIAVVLVIAVTVIIVKIATKEPEKPIGEENKIIQLPETKYSDMSVTDVEMEYLKDNDQTMISMKITNSTDRTIENENLVVHWINKDEDIISSMPTYIERLVPGDQYSISVIQKGDLTSTAQIKLEKK